MSGKILNILGNVLYEDDSITRLEYHSHLPYTTTTFNNNDEIRLPINQQDVYTLPCESYIHIKLSYTNKDNAFDANNKLISNAIAYLFDEIRYEINGSEMDRVKNVGITTTMKNLLTIKPFEVNSLENACWSQNIVIYHRHQQILLFVYR